MIFDSRCNHVRWHKDDYELGVGLPKFLGWVHAQAHFGSGRHKEFVLVLIALKESGSQFAQTECLPGTRFVEFLLGLVVGTKTKCHIQRKCCSSLSGIRGSRHCVWKLEAAR